jgi:hypothetical protein
LSSLQRQPRIATDIRRTFWWPLSLTAAQEAAVAEYATQLRAVSCDLDLQALDRAADLLSAWMLHVLDSILERDGLPHLCHVINGWGNATYKRQSLCDRIEPFIQHNGQFGAAILQAHPEGDFHPWQTFAYCSMAGVSGSTQIGASGHALATLASNSIVVGTKDPCELGHLLFAYSFLPSRLRPTHFFLLDHRYSVSELVDMAVVAHDSGHFEVCRKFHLTEGLCAISGNLKLFSDYRAASAHYLRGQQEMFLVLGALACEMAEAQQASRPRLPAVVPQLREALLLGDLIENHYYYAGHLIELLLLAKLDGFTVQPEVTRAISFVVNYLNELLPHVLPRTAFSEVFLHFGHYRRAITLLRALGSCRSRRDLRRLRAFAVDFDADESRLRKLFSSHRDSPCIGHDFYSVAPPASAARPRFRDIVDLYSSAPEPGFHPRGGFAHFRRMGPPAWPRSLHYELLDYSDAIGCELHLESDSVTHLTDILKRIPCVLPPVSGSLGNWDSTWYGGRGRLRYIFADHVPSSEVAKFMSTFVRSTAPTLDDAVRTPRST